MFWYTHTKIWKFSKSFLQNFIYHTGEKSRNYTGISYNVPHIQKAARVHLPADLMHSLLFSVVHSSYTSPQKSHCSPHKIYTECQCAFISRRRWNRLMPSKFWQSMWPLRSKQNNFHQIFSPTITLKTCFSLFSRPLMDESRFRLQIR